MFIELFVPTKFHTNLGPVSAHGTLFLEIETSRQQINLGDVMSERTILLIFSHYRYRMPYSMQLNRI